MARARDLTFELILISSCLMSFVLLHATCNDADAAFDCTSCHRMPPVDSSFRDWLTGGFKGNHQTHLLAGAAISDCSACHPAAGYTTGHMNRRIDFQTNINNSPATGIYKINSQTITFKNQTTVPKLGKCSNVNCHFETETPQWGTAGFTYNPPLVNDCSKCHAAAPNEGNHPFDTQKHGVYYGTTTSSCAKCHPDHTAEPLPFAHATSAGNRGLLVQFAGTPNNGFGRYTGNVTYPNYLPSQNTGRNGTCKNLYCHSPGTKAAGSSEAPNNSAAWGGTLDCTGCHKGAVLNNFMATGSHYSHVDGGGSSYSQIKCVKCHAATATASMTISDVSRHVDGQIDVAFNSSSSAANGSYNGSLAKPLTPATKPPGSGYGSCQNVYCHSTGQADGGSWPPVYTTPAWGSASTGKCGTCHGTTGSTTHGGFLDASVQRRISSGSHKKHLGYTYGISDSDMRCAVCHAYEKASFNSMVSTCRLVCHTGTPLKHSNHAIDIGIASYFGAAATYNGTAKPGDGYSTCSTVYCHSDGRAVPETYSNPTWGNIASGACGTCHGTTASSPPASPPHAKHVGSAAPYRFACAECHRGKVQATANAAVVPVFTNSTTHVNKVREVTFDSTNPFGTYSSATASCRNLYCHSTGNTAVATVNLPAVYGGKVYARLNWNGTTSCTSCHGRSTASGMPDYANAGTAGSATSNSHSKHVASSAISCNECHERTTKTGKSIRSPYHANGAANVFFNLSGANKAGSYTIATKTCSSTYCHGTTSTVAWGGNTTCVSCHGATFTTFSSLAKKGAHALHIETNTLPASFTASGVGNLSTSGSAYQFGCSSCHNPARAGHANGVNNANGGAAELFFGYTSAVMKGAYVPGILQAATDNGFKWTAGSGCNTSYCHSNGQNAAGRVNVAWNAPKDTLGCDGCHGNGMSSSLSGKHAQHVNPGANADLGLGNGLGCAQCHAKTVINGTTIGDKRYHVNKFIDYSSPQGGGSARYSNLTKQCSTIYCHSNGNPAALVYVTPPAWNSTATLDCNGCHGTGNAIGTPHYENGGDGTATANSHAKHVSGATDTTVCSNCHRKTASLTADGRFKDYSAASYHINGRPNVDFDAAKAGSTASWSSTTGQCSNVSCHGGNAISWGGTANCQDCHGGNTDVDNFSGTFWNNGVTGKIKTTGEWDATGHGKPNGTYSSGNQAANFAVEGKQCEYCHDSSVDHKLSSNPFRLRNYSTAAWGRNAVCQNCHASDSAGVTVGSTLKNSLRKVGSDHNGAKHTSTKNGGQFCWDCHDGHGDTNVYMIHNTVASTSDQTTGAPTATVATSFTAFATGTDYARNAAPYNGICQVCHDSTVNHYTATSGNNHNSGTRCTTCHTHTGATPSTAFPGSESAGGAPCLGCHSAGYSSMQSNTGYHHYMQNDATIYSSTAMPTTNDTNRRCLMCHVDHNIFRPDINASGSRAKNLRTGATDTVSATAGFTNTDFDNALASGGICVSCHANQQAKNTTNRKSDGTTVTPVITKTDYAGSAHNYAVASAPFSDASRVNVNCVKCHDAQNGETSQQSNFGNHDSTSRSLFGALGGTLTDPYESGLCYRCHSKAADAVGGTKKTADANDWYGAVTNMSSRATAIYQVFRKTYKHQVDIAAYSGKHKPNAVDESRTYISNSANKHVGCSDCHNSHTATAANPTKGAMGVNPTNSTANWTAPTAWSDVSVAGGDDEYKICFRCHSGYNTGLISWNSTWTDVGKEFSTANNSFHWIEGDRGAPKADTTYGNFNKTYVYKMMPRYNGFTDAQLRTVKMRCSDCHGSDNAENNPNGPHGSAYGKMLKVPVGSPYTTWNSTSQVGGSNVWCFNCHEPTFANSGFKTSGSSQSLHTSKHKGNKGPCMDCHVKIPHGYQLPHLLKPLSMPAGDEAYNGAPGAGIDLPLNSTNWGLSGRWTENNCGSHQNCSN